MVCLIFAMSGAYKMVRYCFFSYLIILTKLSLSTIMNSVSVQKPTLSTIMNRVSTIMNRVSTMMNSNIYVIYIIIYNYRWCVFLILDRIQKISVVSFFFNQ